VYKSRLIFFDTQDPTAAANRTSRPHMVDISALPTMTLAISQLIRALRHWMEWKDRHCRGYPQNVDSAGAGEVAEGG
jgi:hypothetical protein